MCYCLLFHYLRVHKKSYQQLFSSELTGLFCRGGMTVSRLDALLRLRQGRSKRKKGLLVRVQSKTQIASIIEEATECTESEAYLLHPPCFAKGKKETVDDGDNPPRIMTDRRLEQLWFFLESLYVQEEAGVL